MRKITILTSILSISLVSMFAQPTPQPPNAGFETWTGTGSIMEPTFYNSNKTGTGFASSGPQTCFRDASVFHGGIYSARIETVNYIGTAVNGALTSGLVNAPTFSKADGYIGTIQGPGGTNVNRIAFDGRPDSLVGWFRYTSGGSAEIGKVYAILHLGQYYDPSAASSYHPDSSVNKIGEALFLTPASNVSNWTRFSVPFSYVSSATPQYLLLNCTSSNDQLTTVAGSKLWLDDIAVVYHMSSVGIKDAIQPDDIKVYSFDKIMYVDFMNRNDNQSVLSVFDLTGNLVSKQPLSNNKLNSFSLSELTSGMYLYEVKGTNFHKSGKLVIN